jgi:AbrB family looped-hinge helix DNA binding protein
MARATDRSEVRIDAQGRLVIPAHLRQCLDVHPGEIFVARVEDGRLILERPEAIIQRVRQQLRAAAGDADLVEELLADRREEVRQESTA